MKKDTPLAQPLPECEPAVSLLVLQRLQPAPLVVVGTTTPQSRPFLHGKDDRGCVETFKRNNTIV